MKKEKKDILIIDDEQVIIDAIKKIAQFEGYSTNSALNMDEALDSIDKINYRIIICDIMMPGKSGFEILEFLSGNKITTPVIMTTGFSTLENAVKALHNGAIGFIPKPFSIEELSSIIHRGIKFEKIFKNRYTAKSHNSEELISVVPCPPRYYRLGYDSWMCEGAEGIVKTGLTDIFMKSIDTVVSIELMKVDEKIFQGGVCAKITDSSENVHNVLAPVGGKILSCNNKIITDVNLIEKDPYFEGWIYAVLPEHPENDMENLTTCSSDFNGFQLTIENFIQ